MERREGSVRWANISTVRETRECIEKRDRPTVGEEEGGEKRWAMKRNDDEQRTRNFSAHTNARSGNQKWLSWERQEKIPRGSQIQALAST